jgi:hypothetical protein
MAIKMTLVQRQDFLFSIQSKAGALALRLILTAEAFDMLVLVWESTILINVVAY